jgi:NAD(P)-dependent dehydrogenase (short-subunit alcohol dehydrogenase family)
VSTGAESEAGRTAYREGPKPIALVAGGSRGLGLLIARELAARGHRVVVCARDADSLEQAAADLRARGAEVHTEVCDVSDNAAVTTMVSRVEARLGPIDTLVVVAGIIQVGPLESLERSHFQEAVGTMLWGPVNCALAVAPRMRDRGRGHIATVTSIGGFVSVPHLLPYSTAKFGAVGFTQGLRSEFAGTGVTVTTVAPGLMRTGSHLRATFTGDHAAEYAWFAAGASLPLVSMDAERAASKIVDGVLRGRPLVVLTPLAKVGMRVAGVAPATTMRVMGLLARLLPAPPAEGSTGTLEGREAERRLGDGAARVMRGLTVLGERAARRFNER